MDARVSWLSLTPVKALAFEQVDEAELREDGLHGDRRFYFVDEKNALVNNQHKQRGLLQTIHGSYDEDTGTLSMRLPDGTDLRACTDRGEELQTWFHGHPKQARRVQGPWDDAASELVGEELRLVAPALAAPDRGRGGALSLLGERSLDALAQELDVAVLDARRFRMNIGVEGLDPHAEDTWVGRRLRVGEAVVVPQGHIGRCAITQQDPETGRPDLNTLKALARYRGTVETTEPLPFGIYAAVAEPGHVRVGDAVTLL